MRTKTGNAGYLSLEEARNHVSPSNEVLVIVNDKFARAHPDAELLRPHVVGNSQGFGGADIQMTYCGMSNLGLAYEPQIAGKPVKLEVMAQIGNNLILRDNNTGEPVQQILGGRECDLTRGIGMKPWPTFRMTFRGFQKAYPEGTVYVNLPSSNPFLRVLDTAQDMMFTWGIRAQHRISAPLIDNLTRIDERLPNKTYVWGMNIGSDATCYTDDFVIDSVGPINSTVGGRSIVVAYHREFESIGAWYNDTGAPIRHWISSAPRTEGLCKGWKRSNPACSGMSGRSIFRTRMSIEPMIRTPLNPCLTEPRFGRASGWLWGMC
jgi:hypothetical protein